VDGRSEVEEIREMYQRNMEGLQRAEEEEGGKGKEQKREEGGVGESQELPDEREQAKETEGDEREGREETEARVETEEAREEMEAREERRVREEKEEKEAAKEEREEKQAREGRLEGGPEGFSNLPRGLGERWEVGSEWSYSLPEEEGGKENEKERSFFREGREEEEAGGFYKLSRGGSMRGEKEGEEGRWEEEDEDGGKARERDRGGLGREEARRKSLHLNWVTEGGRREGRGREDPEPLLEVLMSLECFYLLLMLRIAAEVEGGKRTKKVMFNWMTTVSDFLEHATSPKVAVWKFWIFFKFPKFLFFVKLVFP
jgi:hypothetical protein